MPHILIDGYNFIGIFHRDLEQARNDLIGKLNSYARARGTDITVVFDGWKDGRATETRQRIGSVTVIYSRLGEKADDVMKRLLSSSEEPWVAVSSDREVQGSAIKNRIPALTRDEFEAKLDAALGGKACKGSAEAFVKHCDDDDPTSVGKKGNPRKLSKKDRRKQDALKKL